MSSAEQKQEQEWKMWEMKQNNKLHRNYSLRVKGLPPTYASKSYCVRNTLQSMLLKTTAVPLQGVYVTENCLSSKAKHCYAFVYVMNEQDGEQFIHDLAQATLDGVKLSAEWSSRSIQKMPNAQHRLECEGVQGASLWHPTQGQSHTQQTVQNSSFDSR